MELRPVATGGCTGDACPHGRCALSFNFGNRGQFFSVGGHEHGATGRTDDRRPVEATWGLVKTASSDPGWLRGVQGYEAYAAPRKREIGPRSGLSKLQMGGWPIGGQFEAICLESRASAGSAFF
jgi:hypothetical protein